MDGRPCDPAIKDDRNDKERHEPARHPGEGRDPVASSRQSQKQFV
jgi:hypothetical protein